MKQAVIGRQNHSAVRSSGSAVGARGVSSVSGLRWPSPASRIRQQTAGSRGRAHRGPGDLPAAHRVSKSRPESPLARAMPPGMSTGEVRRAGLLAAYGAGSGRTGGCGSSGWIGPRAIVEAPYW